MNQENDFLINVRRLVAAYKPATDTFIRWALDSCSHPAVPHTTEQSPETCLFEFEQAVNELHRQSRRVPEDVRADFKLALDCRHHATRLFAQHERRQDGEISTKTRRHTMFNQRLSEAYHLLCPLPSPDNSKAAGSTAHKNSFAVLASDERIDKPADELWASGHDHLWDHEWPSLTSSSVSASRRLHRARCGMQ
ncbi:uncharacterized protein EKO05_0001806 [Ascochyta rabiei]|uniref:uncharacterized protein n=1 Tax=Didymella rabiei TaxID=5454 RepID=UPI0019000B44|nr:uncharacterized protein EKO05_0001806 [Ascochyta rabiei]UPX11184.1 hypothetical protein EKO05_0001806 [Ascochyta rabiei]